MANLTTTTVVPPAVREYYDRLLLMTAKPALIHQRFAQRRTLPRKVGETIVFRRYSRLATATVVLDDGVTPPGAQLAITDIKASIGWYGNYVILTDQVTITVEDRMLNEASRILALNMGETLDEVTRDVLASTSSVLNCSNGSTAGPPTELTKADIDGAVLTLLGNDAEMITEVIGANDGVGTSPVRPSFWGYIHTDILNDLEQVSGFLSSSQYPNQNSVFNEEWGSTGNVRWLYSSIASVDTSGTFNIYRNFIVGREAYGAVSLESESGEFYVEPLGSSGSADPLHQRATVGFKAPYVARILNDAFMVNLQARHS